MAVHVSTDPSTQAPGSAPRQETPASARATLATLRLAAQRCATDDLGAAQRFEQLERLRARALGLARPQRSHYAGRPLPLAQDERLLWEEHIALWHTLYLAYGSCTRIPGGAAATARGRALDSLGRAIREHGRVYRAVTPLLWRDFNACYLAAETCAAHTCPVPADDGSGETWTCKRIFLATVLQDAAHCYALSDEQLQVVERWLRSWVHDADLLARPPRHAQRSPLAVHLGSDSGARIARGPAGDDDLRYLDTGVLGAHLRELAQALREARHAPALEQALSVLTRTALERLLTHLYIQWCSAGTGRAEERREESGRAQVAVTMHAIHFQIAGRAFRQPGSRYTREEEHDLATFGHITERTAQRLLTGRSAALEPWEIINRGSGGSFGLVRAPDLPTRIGHGQLVAVRTSSITAPVLGAVQRLRVEHDGTLTAGIRALSTEVRAVALRIPAEPPQPYERALLLAADAARSLPESMVLPRGRCAPGSILEMHDGRPQPIRLGGLIERGFDYERLGLERVPT